MNPRYALIAAWVLASFASSARANHPSSQTAQAPAQTQGSDNAQSAAQASSQAQASERDAGIPSREEMMRVRDPFRRPNISVARLEPKTELEKYRLEEFKMVGVTTGPDRIRAMLSTPDNKTHFVSERMKIGMKDGYIRKITSRGVSVREKMVNVFGQEENIDTEIAFKQDDDRQVDGRMSISTVSHLGGGGSNRAHEEDDIPKNGPGIFPGQGQPPNPGANPPQGK